MKLPSIFFLRSTKSYSLISECSLLRAEGNCLQRREIVYKGLLKTDIGVYYF